LRGVAILWVVLFHINGSIPGRPATDATCMAANFLREVLGCGAYGVRIFFFLSGFPLSMRFAKSYGLGDGQIRLGGYR